jgi:predicted Fe-Mo cluster-binding NifX family protein
LIGPKILCSQLLDAITAGYKDASTVLFGTLCAQKSIRIRRLKGMHVEEFVRFLCVSFGGKCQPSTPLPVTMAKAAFASWNDRIAPVFDVAQWIQLVEIESGQIIRQIRANVAGEAPGQKAWRLAELEVGILVCGAISRSMQAVITAYGIEVIAFITGDLQEVIQAWVCGKLAGSDKYIMPGCRRNRGRHWRK